MKATVLGAGGFIGRHLARQLEGRGYEVTRWLRGQPLPEALGLAFYAVGLTRDFAERPEATVEAHAGLLARLLSRHRWDAFIYLSSTRLYDGASMGREDAAIPISVQRDRHLFDASKLLGERCTLGAGGTVARLANVYADSLDGTAFIHDAVRAAVERRLDPVCRHLDAARDYVHVDDVAAALVAMAEQRRFDLVNVASGLNVSNGQLFDALEGWTGHRLRAEARTGAPPAPQVDVERLAGIGVRARPLSQALPELVWRAGGGSPLADERRVA